MKFSLTTTILAGVLCLGAGSAAARAEEEHALMTALSQTTLSGVVDTSAIWALGTPAANILFQDDFETDTSTNWNVFEGSGNATPDYTVQWAFNYATNRYTSNGVSLTIPLAPSSPDTNAHGVKLTVNKNDDVAAVAAVSIYPKDKTFSGNYALRFDMWINYNGGEYGGTGSTEFGTFGINHTGTDVTWAAPAGVQGASDGVWFAVTGEAGAARDYRAYEGDPAGTALEYTGTSGGFIDRDANGTIEQEVVNVTADGPNFPLNLLFPRPPFETTGVPGKRWVQVEVRQIVGKITWLIDGYIIAERENTSLWTTGNIMLGTMDIFSSVANPKGDNFVIFDNLRVVSLTDFPVEPIRLTLTASAASASEPATHGSFTITRTGDAARLLPINLRVRGTAGNGEDYERIPVTTNMPIGVNTLVIPITVINDQRGEPAETVRLDLVNNLGAYEVFAPMTAGVDIADDNDITTVNLTVTDAHAYEKIPSDTAKFQITRVGDVTVPLTVNLAFGGTAQAGADFQSVGNSIVIPAGAESASVQIIPINNSITNENRTVTLTLAEGTGYALGTQTNGTVTIRNDDIPAGTVVFSDNFETDSSAQWTVNEASAGLNRATFNWDYNTLGIPAAPNTTNGTTRGLRLQANTGEVGTFTGLSVSPIGFGIEGDYRLRFDMWINYNGPLNGGGAGSTMMLSTGLGTSGKTAQFPGTSVEGVLFAVTGEGGAAQDYRAYASTAQLEPPSGVFAAGTQSGARNNSDAYYAPFGGVTAPEAQLAAFPEQTGVSLAGTPGMAWHEVTIEKRGTNISWFVDNLRIATIPLTNKQISTNIFVGFFDINPTQTGNQDLSFGLVDNLRVERLDGTQPGGDIQISSITRSGANVQITFTAPAQAQNPVVEGAAVVSGPYATEPNVQLENVSAGPGNAIWRATIPMTTPSRFFRIRQ
jgi:hypothetical protein